MNWYVLFVQTDIQERLCDLMQADGLDAFLPEYEHYRRDRKAIERKRLFPGYVFIRTDKDSRAINLYLQQIRNYQLGFVKKLGEDDCQNLSELEIDQFEHMLDEAHVVRMSYGYVEIEDGEKYAVVMEGPLKYFQDQIWKLDAHNRLAYVWLEFDKEPVKMGLTILKKEKWVEEAE